MQHVQWVCPTTWFFPFMIHSIEHWHIWMSFWKSNICTVHRFSSLHFHTPVKRKALQNVLLLSRGNEYYQWWLEHDRITGLTKWPRWPCSARQSHSHTNKSNILLILPICYMYEHRWANEHVHCSIHFSFARLHLETHSFISTATQYMHARLANWLAWIMRRSFRKSIDRSSNVTAFSMNPNWIENTSYNSYFVQKLAWQKWKWQVRYCIKCLILSTLLSDQSISFSVVSYLKCRE